MRIGSHREPLAYAVSHTEGPVLELGAGDFSTPMLHELCCPGRLVVTMDSKAEWLNRFRYLESERHVFRLVDPPTLDGWRIVLPGILGEAGRFSVALIDHSPADARNATAEIVRPFCDVLVVHDLWRGTGMKPLTASLLQAKYSRKYSRSRPATGVLSDTVDVTAWPDL